WRLELRASHASPVATRLGKEDVVISPAGAIIRVRDGKVLATGSFRASQSSPVVAGDTVCVYSRDAVEVVRLTLGEEGKVSVKSLWSADGSGERHQLPSPLVHDGMLYAVTTSGILNVIDMSSGKRVYRQRLPVSQVYSSVALAGGLLYVLDL